MKIALNLSTMPSARERYALVWGVPMAVIGLAALVLLSVAAVRNLREYRAVRRSVGELQQVEARVHEQEMALRRNLEGPQLRDMYRQARFINTVIDRRQFSATELLEKVAPLVPDEVRLTAMSLKHSGKHLEVRFAVVGNADEGLEKFLTNLEDSPDFADVAILTQGFAPEGAENELVTLSCSARYLGVSPP
jgi:Tfp pilus assembly protein PilN